MTLIIVLVAVLALLMLLYVRHLEHKNLYFPTREMEQSPEDAGLVYEDVFLDEDGVKIHGWYFPVEASKSAVLFFHGNGENISHRLDIARIFGSRGYDVLLAEYRGYGRSEGTPSEQALYSDARAFYDYLVEEKSKKPGEIVVYGYSLGGAVAIDLASKVEAAVLVVQSSFTSTEDMGKVLYPNIPMGRFVRQRYDSIAKLPDIGVPVLVIHSPEDEMVPFEHGKRLFEAARQPKKFIEISGDHGGASFFEDEVKLEELFAFLSEHSP